MDKLSCRVFAIAVLVGAIFNFTAIFKSSPAFNSDERMESVVGGWRVPNAASHYDKAEYRLGLAYGYLNELGLTYDPETDKMVMIDAQEMSSRTSKALEHIKESLQLDPANASAWAYLAQAHSRTNEIDAMRDSLNRSWSLAPHNLQLAPLRLSLVMMIDQSIKDAPQQSAPFSEDEIEAVRRDGAVLRKIAPRYVTGLTERSDAIKTLLDTPEISESSNS